MTQPSVTKNTGYSSMPSASIDDNYVEVPSGPPSLTRQVGYVKDDKQKENKENKTKSNITIQTKTHEMLAKLSGRGIRAKLPVVAVTLTYKLGLASSANTAFNTVQSVTPSNSSEFAGFAALYDEMIVDGGSYEFAAFSTGTVPAGVGWGVLGFDPVNFGVYTSVANGSETTQHIRFPFIASLGPSVITPLGPIMHKWTWRGPKGKPARISGSSNTSNFEGEWSATSDANDSYGFIKPYFEANGASVLTNLSGFVTLHCRFRSRT